MASVREYAILYVGRKGPPGGGSASGLGGNAIYSTEPHALDGPEHTGNLPIERISTDELDTSLVVHPDGAGGLAFDAESGSMVPYYIGTGETFTVPEFRQALFSETIDGPGFLDVDGLLLEVD